LKNTWYSKRDASLSHAKNKQNPKVGRLLSPFPGIRSLSFPEPCLHCPPLPDFTFVNYPLLIPNSVSKTHPSTLGLGSGQNFNVTFTFIRSAADTLSLSLNITGIDSSGNAFNYTVTGSDNAGIVSTFDTFAFSVNNPDVDLGMKSVGITKTSAIPEPAATTALFGALLFLRRLRLPPREIVSGTRMLSLLRFSASPQSCARSVSVS
jgi:hypothetical protein